MVKSAGPVPVVDGLFTPEGEPRLLASRCSECGAAFFPRRSYCRNPQCSRTALQPIALGRRGALHSFTVQHYMAPHPFRLDASLLPYTLALVEFPEGVRVLGMLAEGADPAKLRIGMPMEVTLGRLYTREDGQEVVTWKFRPAAG